MHWPEIAKDTPLTEVKRIHQQIWDYVIEHGEKPNTPYYKNCVACQYACIQKNHWGPACTYCPIVWPDASCDDLYKQWYLTYYQGLRTMLARQIRDMPFKYELEEKQND